MLYGLGNKYFCAYQGPSVVYKGKNTLAGPSEVKEEAVTGQSNIIILKLPHRSCGS
jgi:hypothetical protein